MTPGCCPCPVCPPSSAAMGIGIAALARGDTRRVSRGRTIPRSPPPSPFVTASPPVSAATLPFARSRPCVACRRRRSRPSHRWLSRAVRHSIQPDSPWATPLTEMDAWAEGLVEGLWEPSPNTSPSKDTTAQMGAAGGFTVGAGGVLRQELERNLAQGTEAGEVLAARRSARGGESGSKRRAEPSQSHLPPGAREGPTPYMSELRRPRPPLRLCGSCGRPARVRALL